MLCDSQKKVSKIVSEAENTSQDNEYKKNWPYVHRQGKTWTLQKGLGT